MELNEKQKRFCDEYLIDLNGRQAAIRAGYSQATAEQQASRLLTNVKVQEYLRERQKILREQTEITQQRVVAEYARIAFSDIRAFYEQDGKLKPIHTLDADAAATLAGIEVDEIWVGSGEDRMLIGETKKIKRWDKVKALDSICRVLGYNAPEKHEDVTQYEVYIGKKKLSDE